MPLSFHPGRVSNTKRCLMSPPWQGHTQHRSSAARQQLTVLHIPSTTTGWAQNGLRAALSRRTWGSWLISSSTWPSNLCWQPRKPTVSRAASSAARPAGRERWFCPSALVWWDPTWSPASSSGALRAEKTWTCKSRSRGGHKNDQRTGTPLMRKGWESWGWSAWRREGSRKTS